MWKDVGVEFKDVGIDELKKRIENVAELYEIRNKMQEFHDSEVEIMAEKLPEKSGEIRNMINIITKVWRKVRAKSKKKREQKKWRRIR